MIQDYDYVNQVILATLKLLQEGKKVDKIVNEKFSYSYEKGKTVTFGFLIFFLNVFSNGPLCQSVASSGIFSSEWWSVSQGSEWRWGSAKGCSTSCRQRCCTNWNCRLTAIINITICIKATMEGSCGCVSC